jgi:hypothetical protein
MDKVLNKISASLVNPQKDSIKEIVQLLIEAEVNLHILHLQSKNKSGWEHTALGDLYEALPDMLDDLVEKSYVKIGTITNYKSITIKEENPLSYVKSLMTSIETSRMGITTGYIQQMIDNILEKIAHTIYKLENVK